MQKKKTYFYQIWQENVPTVSGKSGPIICPITLTLKFCTLKVQYISETHIIFELIGK